MYHKIIMLSFTCHEYVSILFKTRMLIVGHYYCYIIITVCFRELKNGGGSEQAEGAKC